MRKLMYFLMFVMGAAFLFVLFTMPIYKFDNEKTLKNYSEYEYYIYNEGSIKAVKVVDGNKLIDAAYTGNAYRVKYVSKEDFDENVYNKEVLAINAAINGDAEEYYNNHKYEVVDTIYFMNPLKFDDHFNASTPDEQVEIRVASAKSSLLEMEYNKVVILNPTYAVEENRYKAFNEINKDHKYFDKDLTSNDELTQEIMATIGNTLYESQKEAVVANNMSAISSYIINKLGGEEAAENIGLVGACDVLSSTLKLVDVNSSAEELTASVKKYQENGLKTLDLIDTWKNTVKYYKDSFASEDMKDAKFMAKAKFVVSAKGEFNVWPTVIYTLIMLFLALTGLKYVFGGLKGIKGRKYPRLFIRSLLLTAICFVLYSRKLLLPLDFVLKYRGTEMTRLFDIMLFGNFQLPILAGLAVGALGTVFSIFGKFCKWEKKR